MSIYNNGKQLLKIFVLLVYTCRNCKQLLKKKYFLYTYIKMVNKCYQKHKEKLRKEACKRYQNLYKKKKKDKRRLETQNLSEEEKWKKVEYMRNCCLTHKK